MGLHDKVAAMMRKVAAETVMPRFRMLSGHDVVEKSPGELVTIADREAEQRFYEGLDALGLGARIVGEEAAAADPSLIARAGEGLVWLIDPLDGTANFAAGHGPFGIMIALVEDGIPIAGWMLDPVSGRLCHAERGKGATCDGTAVRASARSFSRPIAALGSQFMSEEERTRLHARGRNHMTLVPIPRCAAESYPRLVLGRNDVALFQRILPWDHAAGVLFLEEAGGRAAHWDGAPFRVGGSGRGLLLAAEPRLWDKAAAALLPIDGGIAIPELRAA